MTDVVVSPQQSIISALSDPVHVSAAVFLLCFFVFINFLLRWHEKKYKRGVWVSSSPFYHERSPWNGYGAALGTVLGLIPFKTLVSCAAEDKQAEPKGWTEWVFFFFLQVDDPENPFWWSEFLQEAARVNSHTTKCLKTLHLWRFSVVRFIVCCSTISNNWALTRKKISPFKFAEKNNVDKWIFEELKTRGPLSRR